MNQSHNRFTNATSLPTTKFTRNNTAEGKNA